MSVIYVALPIAILLGGAGMIACVLCIRNGQYDDLETPSVRMLIDERKVIDQKETPVRDTSAQDTPAQDTPARDTSARADPSDDPASAR